MVAILISNVQLYLSFSKPSATTHMQPVGTIPRTLIITNSKHIIKSSIFMSNLISSPLRNFLVNEKDVVEKRKYIELIRDIQETSPQHCCCGLGWLRRENAIHVRNSSFSLGGLYYFVEIPFRQPSSRSP